MKTILKVGLLGMVGMLSGCGNSGAPTCVDEDVVGLVKQIASDPLGTQLLGKYFAEDLTQGNGDIASFAMQYPAWGYKEWKEKSQISNKPFQDMITSVTHDLGKMNVTAIRSNGVNNAAQKVSCGAQLEIPGLRAYPVDYTAQYTEDNQVWVEVSGLPQ